MAITLNDAKKFLANSYKYAIKDMKSEAVVMAMYAQEQMQLVKEDEDTYNIYEDYAITSFDKPLVNIDGPTVLNAELLGTTQIAGTIDLELFMANYKKYGFNLKLWCWLAQQINGETQINLNTLNDTLFNSAYSKKELGKLFDDLKVIGYLSEPATGDYAGKIVFTMTKPTYDDKDTQFAIPAKYGKERLTPITDKN